MEAKSENGASYAKHAFLTLYDQLKAAGCELDHHESDLYVKATPDAIRILNEYRRQRSAGIGFRAQGFTIFTSQIDGKLWYDIPFAYAPYWRGKQAKLDADEIVTRAAPRWAWDLIDETLEADTRASNFDNELRQRISEAYEAMIAACEGGET